MNKQIPQGVQEGGARSSVDIQKLAEEINKLRGSLDSVFDKFDGEVTLVFQGKSYTISNTLLNQPVNEASVVTSIALIVSEITSCSSDQDRSLSSLQASVGKLHQDLDRLAKDTTKEKNGEQNPES